MTFTIRFPGGARVDAQLGHHTIATDQPVGAGGEDSAPSPFDLFLASIGTCAGIYVLGFCRNRGISAEGIELTQSLDVDPVSHLVTDIHLEIHVPASFPPRYYDALVRAADQCKVKKHLEHPPHFDVRTVAHAA